ncbi:MAG TPA: hypothetical protein VMF89_04130 [Polyangiales bacterium]|nr:hypothetical protein [Polyangiales bacterium]
MSDGTSEEMNHEHHRQLVASDAAARDSLGQQRAHADASQGYDGFDDLTDNDTGIVGEY